MSWVMYKLETISQYKIVKLYVSMLQNIEGNMQNTTLYLKPVKLFFEVTYQTAIKYSYIYIH